MYQFRISKSAISLFVPEVCAAIYCVLQKEYLKFPSMQQEWENIAKGFEERWQFPNCIGAGDGKHIRLRHPYLSGSTFYNYKNFYSIVLLAIVDSDYKFIYIDVGCQGRLSDGGVFQNSSFAQGISDPKNPFNLPPPKPLPQSEDTCYNNTSNDPLPYCWVGDDAFALSLHCMKPYPHRGCTQEEQIFNYRLSRVRRISENVFGILASRFRLLHTMICATPENSTKFVLAICALHNYLRCKVTQLYTPNGSLDVENVNDISNASNGDWRSDSGLNRLQSLPQEGSNHSSKKAQLVRDKLKDHFIGP